jgi:hypothetical protein
MAIHQEDIMKAIIKKSALFSLCSVTSAFAASGAEEDGSGIYFWLFIGFAALIIAFQFVPGIMMMCGMAKGILGSETKKAETAAETGKH